MSLDLSFALAPWLTSLAAVFFIVDPIAATPTFLAITAGFERTKRRHMARRAALTCWVLLSTFAVIGKYVFRLFGITMPAFRLAGGLLLLLVALDMLQARQSRTRETPEEQHDAQAHEDVGMVPMGLPILAGPGSLSTVMVLVGQGRTWLEIAPVLLSIAITAAAVYAILRSADHVEAVLGEIGIRVLTRLMGLMLTAIAFQFFVNALVEMHIIGPVPLP